MPQKLKGTRGDRKLAHIRGQFLAELIGQSKEALLRSPLLRVPFIVLAQCFHDRQHTEGHREGHRHGAHE